MDLLKRKPITGMGLVEFVMSENIAVIPKGTKVQIMGCSYTLIEDVKVDGNQANLDYILKEQENFYKGIGVASGGGLKIPTT